MKIVREKSTRISTLSATPIFGSIAESFPYSIQRFSGNIPSINYEKIDHYLICWSSKGCGKMRLRFLDRDIPKGRLYFLRPGTIQTFIAYPTDGWLLRFRPQYVSNNTRLLFSTPHIDLENTDPLDILARQMSDTASNEPLLIGKYICLIVELVSSYYRQQHGIPAIHPHHQVLLKLLDLVDQHFRSETRNSFYARRLGVVDRKLNEVCLKGTGLLVPELIEDRRLSEIEKLLSATKMLLKEIAHELGFINSSHLTYWFRQRRGLTPKEYRLLTLKEISYR